MKPTEFIALPKFTLFTLLIVKVYSVGGQDCHPHLSICYLVLFEFYYVTTQESVVLLRDYFSRVYSCILHSI